MLRYIALLSLVVALTVAAAVVRDEDHVDDINSLEIKDYGVEEGRKASITRTTEWSKKQAPIQNKSQDVESSRKKKPKLKKKHKKHLMHMLSMGLLLKSLMLPLAIGFLKLLTGKAMMVTLMALGLVTALTMRGAQEKSVTEIINLVPKEQKGRSLHMVPEKFAQQVLGHF